MIPDKTITRQALYDRIWATPIAKLAEEFGVTGAALKAICERYAVPTPRSGYWMKKEFGKPVEQPHLTEVDGLSADTEIVLVKEKLTKPIARPLPTQPATTRAPASSPPAAALPSNPTESSPLPQLDLHSLLGPTRKSLERPAAAGTLVKSGGKGAFSVTVSAEQVARALEVLNVLIQTIEAQGWSIARSDNSLQLCPDDEPVGFTLVEQTHRVLHMTTDADREALARYEKRREASRRRGEWLFDMDRPTIPEWDYRPTGRLVLQFDENPLAYSVASGLRRTFSETPSRRLEDQIERIIEALAARAAASKEIRRLAAEQKARWAQEAARRQEFERLQRLEAKRLEFFKRQFERHEEARRLEDFLSRYATSDLSPHPEAASFVEWAERRLAALETDLAPDTLANRLKKVGLMNDDADISSWTMVE